VLFGATADLAKRKLNPGLAYLEPSALAPDIRVVGTSHDDLSAEEFRTLAKQAVKSIGIHQLTDDYWASFTSKVSYIPQSVGSEALAATVAAAEPSSAPMSASCTTCRYHSPAPSPSSPC